MISFILPVYNKEPYIDQCLDSIRHQSGAEIEIICVDNNSTDGSRELLEKHAREDGRIQIVDEPTQGVSAARNCGMGVARGDYLSFIDADDYIEPDFAAVAQRIGAESGFDVLLYEYDSLYEEDNRCVAWRQRSMPEPVMKARDLAEDLFLFSSPAVTTKVFRREFVEENALKFDNKYSQGEDLEFTCMSLMLAGTVAQYQDKVMYHRHADVAGSATELRRVNGDSLQVFDVLDALVAFADERGLPQASKMAIYRQALSEIRYAADIASTPAQFEEVYSCFTSRWQDTLREMPKEKSGPYLGAYEAFVETGSALEAMFALLGQRRQQALKDRKTVETAKAKLAKEKKARKKAQKRAEELQAQLDSREGKSADGHGFVGRAARKVLRRK